MTLPHKAAVTPESRVSRSEPNILEWTKVGGSVCFSAMQKGETLQQTSGLETLASCCIHYKQTCTPDTQPGIYCARSLASCLSRATHVVGHYYPCGVQGGGSADYLLSAGFQRAVMISDLSESFGQPIRALAPLKQSHEQILRRLCNYFVTLRPHQVTSTTRVTRRCSLTGRGKSS